MFRSLRRRQAQRHAVEERPSTASQAMPFSTISLDQYFAALRKAHDGDVPLNEGQRQAIEHDSRTPLWIIAGPGTGKTHTLVWLVLKRMLVNGVAPDRVVLTTFTRKAAAELESRLILNRQQLISAGCREAEGIDVMQVHLGTLHSLCSQLLQDLRYEPTLHIRVLEDELTQQFFIRRSRNLLVRYDDRAFWQRFGVAKAYERYSPNTASRTAGACAIFNRMTENSVDLDMMLQSGDPDFELVAQAYQEYEKALTEHHRTDQAHLQRHFLDFLATPIGKTWLGEGFTVFVDEYQDTNPIQEEIYFTFAGQAGDLTVVGDDDQSLYRFRGATVESLIDFDRACQAYLGKTPTPVHLHENRRSHPAIVDWVNRFITYHPDMRDAVVRVRAPDKPLLDPRAAIAGEYPAIMAIIEGKHREAADKLAQAVRELRDDGLVSDYSQVALLSFSTRESTRGIGAYTDALHAADIPLYNPRNRTAQKDRRVKAMLGALSVILDPEGDAGTLPFRLPRGVPEYLQDARDEYAQLAAAAQYRELAAYVQKSAEAIRHTSYDASESHHYLTRIGGRRVTINGLLYKLLAYEPFASDLTDVEGGERLKALNQILAEYESLYDDGELQIELDADAEDTTRISRWTLYNFYAVFIEGIHDGLNDPEDDEISIQPGMVNVMTIHQAKGLEFEVVFVVKPEHQPSVGETQLLEDLLDPFIRRPTKPVRRAAELRAAEDTVRLFFVAYSRAKRLLVLTGQQRKGMGSRAWAG